MSVTVSAAGVGHRPAQSGTRAARLRQASSASGQRSLEALCATGGRTRLRSLFGPSKHDRLPATTLATQSRREAQPQGDSLPKEEEAVDALPDPAQETQVKRKAPRTNALTEDELIRQMRRRRLAAADSGSQSRVQTHTEAQQAGKRGKMHEETVRSGGKTACAGGATNYIVRYTLAGNSSEATSAEKTDIDENILVSTGKHFLERGRMRDCRRGPRGGQALALQGQGSMYSEGCAAQPTRRPAPLLWRRLLEQARQRRRWAVIGHHLGRGRQRARLAAQLEGQPRAGGTSGKRIATDIIN